MSDSDNQSENTEGLAEGVSSAPELPTGADQRLFLVVVDFFHLGFSAILKTYESHFC